jgi:hypothetical protein
VLPVFIQNPVLNGFIAFVFVIGVFSCFWQVGQLVISVRWIEGFLGHRETPQAATAPRLLAPLATLLRSRGARMQISATSTRSILDSVGTRIDEAREITRYVGNLLIFLGLLGTFYGLATTVPALVQTIGDLSPRPGESGQDVFNLFASHGQNRFYRELEEWLSSFTRVGFSEGEGGGDHGVVAGVLDHMAAQMEKLRDIFARGEASRGAVDDKLSQLADSLERMTDRLEASTPSTTAMLRLAESQERLVEVLENREASEGLDAESRMRLRSIDVQMLRILEEISAGRQESMAELRTDLSAIGRALSQMRLAPAPQPTTRRPPAKPEGREG